MKNEPGWHNGEKVYCPVNGWDCPYFRKETKHYGQCMIDDAMEDCNDFATMWESWEEWEAAE